MSGYQTTKKDYDKFKQETKYWVDKLGLYDFEITVAHDQTNDDALAEATVNREACWANSTLQHNWDAPPYAGQIERVAFHEAMEIVLSPLWMLAERRFVTPDELEQAKHTIIKRLENCVWKPDFDKRKKK